MGKLILGMLIRLSKWSGCPD